MSLHRVVSTDVVVASDENKCRIWPLLILIFATAVTIAWDALLLLWLVRIIVVVMAR